MSAVALGTAALAAVPAASLATSAATAATTPTYSDNLGIQPGLVKHVWYIILENKSYDASFTGLDNNTYLWNTLPHQGALLTNYYATGHSSQDNYTSLVSGQAPQPDVQADCVYYNGAANAATAGGTATNAGVDLSGAVLNPGGTLNWQSTFSANPNYGQWTSATGANSYVSTEGCVYPTSVSTLFNQFDSAGITWKGYSQDLGFENSGTVATTPAALTIDEDACGAPFDNAGESASSPTYPVASVPASTVTSQANPGSATSAGAYVPKHFPFPWFQSLLNSSGDCNPQHIGPMFDDPTTETAGQNVGDFYSDLQADASNPSKYPNFVWITPNNCSDAHDAGCANNGATLTPTSICTDPTTGNGCSEGGNLSNSTWDAPDIPSTPTNGLGGLYAADKFLNHVIPEIESSTEYKDGGLIDISFDEGYPPYTYQGQSFYNDDSAHNSSQGQTPGASSALATDANGETLDVNGTYTSVSNGCLSSASTSSPGQGGARETLPATGSCIPTGPNTPLVTDPSTGEQMSPGPGNAADLDKADNCKAEPGSSNGVTISLFSGSTPGTCILGTQADTYQAGNALGIGRTVTTANDNSQGSPLPSGSYWIPSTGLRLTDEGRSVTGTGIPAGSTVGTVVQAYQGFVDCTPPIGATAPVCNPSGLNPALQPVGNNGLTYSGWFEIDNSGGTPVPTNAAVPVGTSLTFGAFCDPTPATMGGTGADCSSGQATDPYYNTTSQTAGGGLVGAVMISPYIKPGSVSATYYNHYSWLRSIEDLFGVGGAAPGLDGLGHLGYAAQPGLVPFGPDVFTNAPGAEGLLINEWRPTGPSGAGDDYVDLANQSGSAVSTSGWDLEFAYANGSTQTVPLTSGDTIPSNGHYLVADTGYSLGTTATPDQNVTLTGTPVGVELIDTNTDTVQDAVGFTSAPGGFSLGTALTAPGTYPTGQFAWVRKFANGALVNTGSNASDFTLVSTTNAGQSAYGSPTFGDPSPADLSAPSNVNDFLQVSQLDPNVDSQTKPNLVYDGTAGTLDFNLQVTNCSGQPATGVCVNNADTTTPYTVNRLQFRITALSPSLQSETSVSNTFSDSHGNSFTTNPLSLLPPAGPTGGLNSVLVGTADLPTGGLLPGGSIAVNFHFSAPKAPNHFGYSYGFNTEDDFVPTGSVAAAGSTSAPTVKVPNATPILPEISGTVSSSGAVTVVVTPETKAHAKKKAKHHHRKHSKKHRKYRVTKHHAG